jgi:hypothetical protein
MTATLPVPGLNFWDGCGHLRLAVSSNFLTSAAAACLPLSADDEVFADEDVVFALPELELLSLLLPQPAAPAVRASEATNARGTLDLIRMSYLSFPRLPAAARTTRLRLGHDLCAPPPRG